MWNGGTHTRWQYAIYTVRATAGRFIMISNAVRYQVLVWIDLAAVNNLIFQYDETNVMHFSLNLLRIKGLYMFRAEPGVA
jgi:hypothetical protein